ncbi:serine/threonine protein kinase [Streptomyces verrucosisporus]|uniref:Stk1 family PASTA domain-containing Ser/Thr kinase n=1 Tax=Streptomyces verrucosisporus TaxID=1695161 RepID=UPI0019CF68D5|nr:Stk1 family PASTA domain-containing Ser/Thr kinase [Streptomyces verrucosisporus]MBN3929240.1 serine/threonine protein kinase [Streptomyces verrucosisporus]
MSDDGAQAAYRGRTVGGGRYQLRDLLGQGGMASVHLAYDTVLDRQVAVKTLHTELGREQSFRERFRREAQAVAKLTHTNIVSVFDSGEDEADGATVPYIVMEYVEGKPLRTVLDEDVARLGAMPSDKALTIVSEVLAALEASHEVGLVHRDIKPGNVMLNRRGTVKVMDFGIARAMQSGVTSMTQTGMVVGTPQYLSPEQALGRGVDARSDLYSVGIMLFELLTGRLPFDADSPLAIAYAHVQEEPPVPSSVNRSLPAAVDALIARTLRKNPNERFPTAEAMRQECERVRNSVVASNTTPLIAGGAPGPNSGAAVSQSVFPPVDAQTTPPPPNVQQPYQPHYAPAAGFGAAGPVQQGYSTPVPGPYGPQGGAPTPPPYTVPPQPSGGRNTGVIVGSAVAAIIVVAAVIIAVTLNGGSGEDPRAGESPGPVRTAEQPAGTGGGDSGGTGGQETEGEGTGTDTDDGGDDGDDGDDGFKDEDTSKTIDPAKCTEASESLFDKGKTSMPDLTFKHLDSVKDCVREAGWVLEDVEYEDENLYGKNTVLKQSPEAYDGFDPKKDKITLTVSTGHPEG